MLEVASLYECVLYIPKYRYHYTFNIIVAVPMQCCNYYIHVHVHVHIASCLLGNQSVSSVQIHVIKDDLIVT